MTLQMDLIKGNMEPPARLLLKYAQSDAEIDRLSQEDNEFAETKKEEERNISSKYYDQIRELEYERDRLITACRKEKEAHYQARIEQAEILHEDIAAVDRILTMLRWNAVAQDRKQNVDFEQDEACLGGYGDKHVECIDVFYKDEYLKICAYIHSNSKPKNKYTLAMAGRCWFPESILKWPYGHVDLHTKGYGSFSVNQTLNYKPTIAQLKAYYEKKKAALLYDEMAVYQKTRTEFNHIVKEYSVDDFMPLLAYTCDCGWFETIRASKHRRLIASWNGHNYECPWCKLPVGLLYAVEDED